MDGVITFYRPDAILIIEPTAPYGRRGCKNRPAPFPGWMS